MNTSATPGERPGAAPAGTGAGATAPLRLHRFDDVIGALRNPGLAVPAWPGAEMPGRAFEVAAAMPSMHDGPHQRRALNALYALLSPANVGRADSRIQQLVETLMREALGGQAQRAPREPLNTDGARASRRGSHGSEVDLVDRFTALLAPTVLCALFELDHALSPTDLRELSGDLGLLLSPGDPPAARAAAERAEPIIDTLAADLSRRAAKPQPTDPLRDLLASDASSDELVAAVALVAAGGQETVSSLAANLLVRLVADSTTRTAFEQNPLDVVDEVARLTPPIRLLARTARTGARLGGQPVHPGTSVLIALTGALRDPARFEAAEEFRPGRGGDPGLAFGLGAHRCPGRSLARALAVAAGKALLAAWGPQRVAVLEVGGRPTVPVFSGPTRLVVRVPANV